MLTPDLLLCNLKQRMPPMEILHHVCLQIHFAQKRLDHMNAEKLPIIIIQI